MNSNQSISHQIVKSNCQRLNRYRLKLIDECCIRDSPYTYVTIHSKFSSMNPLFKQIIPRLIIFIVSYCREWNQLIQDDADDIEMKPKLGTRYRGRHVSSLSFVCQYRIMIHRTVAQFGYSLPPALPRIKRKKVT